MKKLLIAILLSVIIILTPMSSSIKTEFFENIDINTKSFNSFKIKLTNETINQIYQMGSEIEDSILRNKALIVIDQILTKDGELKVNKFFSIISEEGIAELYRNKVTTDVLDDLYNFIFELIVERLGWLNDLFEKTTDIIDDAKNLWDDRTIPMEIRNEIQKIIDKLNELESLLTLLAEGKYFQFIKEWSPFVLINDTVAIIQSISTIASDLGVLFGDIQSFIYDISDFILWFRSEPWKNQIHIYGRVMEGIFNGISNVTISCLNITTQTDEYGNFSMYITPTLSEDSFPPNEYYGIHKCVITAEKNGITKSSIDSHSYVFSDGSIYWIFLLTDDDSISNEYVYYLEKILLNHPILFSILMKIINN